MGFEHLRASREGTGERRRGTDGRVVPLAQEWREWAGALLVIWMHARRADAGVPDEVGSGEPDPALAAMMEASRPEWPPEDRARFIEHHLQAFTRLADDASLRDEMSRRGWGEARRDAVRGALADLSARVADVTSLTAAQAVAAGLVGRYGGAHRRAAYILDNILDPASLGVAPAGPERAALPDVAAGRVVRVIGRGLVRLGRAVVGAARSL